MGRRADCPSLRTDMLEGTEEDMALLRNLLLVLETLSQPYEQVQHH